jgi:cation diffusion facilitator CzcD-associated flavoprotein CzcO
VDWQELRAQSHRMLDDVLDYVAGIRDRHVSQPMNQAVRAAFRADLPQGPTELSQVHEDFLKYVLSYVAGNLHPGFMGWVHGGGTVVGMLAEMLASRVNANCGGRDHAPIEVERQIADWSQRLLTNNDLYGSGKSQDARTTTSGGIDF